MGTWFLGVGQEKIGPLASEEVIARFKRGDINENTLVWTQGQSAWTRLIEQVELSKLLPVPVEYVGVGSRTLAYLLDSAVLGVINFLVLFTVAHVLHGVGQSAEMVNLIVKRASSPIAWAVSVFYFVLLQASFGGSIGKLALGLRLVSADFKELGFAQSFLRYGMLIVSLAPLGLGVFLLAFHEKKQGWHDRVAKTAVVTVKSLKAYQLKEKSREQQAAASSVEPEIKKVA